MFDILSDFCKNRHWDRPRVRQNARRT